MATITLEDNPYNNDVQVLRDGLSAYNVARVPQLLSQPRGDVAIIARGDNKQVIGGAIGEYDWGWLYIDTLWVDDDHRLHGLGAQLLNAIEQYAYAQGIYHSYLMTTSFQARPFYEKRGYAYIGQNENRPRGHTMYYLQKALTQGDANPSFEVQSPPNANTLQFIDAQFKEGTASIAPLDNHKMAVFLRDEDGHVRGGLFGGIFWDWFDLRLLWIDESYRERGYASRLLQIAEDECMNRGVYGIVTDTASFQALDLYLGRDFEVFATLADRPPGHETYLLQKLLIDT